MELWAVKLLKKSLNINNLNILRSWNKSKIIITFKYMLLCLALQCAINGLFNRKIEAIEIISAATEIPYKIRFNISYGWRYRYVQSVSPQNVWIC